MRWSVALPGVGPGVTAQHLAEAAVAAEEAGIDAVHVTEHPFPPAPFVEAGGHEAFDALVALSVVAASTTRVQLHTNVLIAAYRNPFLAAKGIATLDALSGGRVIVGIGAGYLEGEFRALGARYDDRAQRVVDDVAAMRAAWTGEPVHLEGDGWWADGNVMRPTPARHVPVWVGGNSRAAIRRAVAIGDGWMPFVARPRTASVATTAAISDIDDLRARMVVLHEELDVAGLDPASFEVCATPFTHRWGGDRFEPAELHDEAAELEAVGVTWLAVQFPGPDVAGAIEQFADAR